MQVGSDRSISDFESVSIGVSKLKHYFDQTRAELEGPDRLLPDGVILQRIVAKYNRDDNYVAAVAELVRILAVQVAPEYRVDYERLWTHADSDAERPKTNRAPDPTAPSS